MVHCDYANCRPMIARIFVASMFVVVYNQFRLQSVC